MQFGKIFLILFVMFIGKTNAQINVSTTPELRNVIIENWSGNLCGWCTVSDAQYLEIRDTFPNRVFGMNVHVNGWSSTGSFDLTSPEGNTHHNGFTNSITGYPASMINRMDVYGVKVFNYFSDTIKNYFIPSILNDTSEVNLYTEASVDAATRVLDVDVEYFYTSDATNDTNFLYVVLLQNHIIGPQACYGNGSYNPAQWINSNQYDHLRVVRDFISPQWGEPILNTTTGATSIMNYSTVIPDSINGLYVDLSDLEILIFMNDGANSNGDIITGIGINPVVNSLGVLSESLESKKLIKIIDMAGRETDDNPNTPLIYIYSDGTTEKVFRVE